MSFGLGVIVTILQYLSIYIDNRILIGKLEISVRRIALLSLAIFVGVILFNWFGVYALIYIFISNLLFNFQDKKKMLSSLGFISLTTILNLISDHVISFFDNVFQIKKVLDVSMYVVIHVSSSLILSLAFTILAKKVIAHYLPSDLDSKEGDVISVILLFTYVIYMLCIFLGVFLGNTPDLIQLNLIFFLVYLILLLIAFTFYSKSMHKELELKKKEFKFESLQQYTDDLEKQYNQIRKFRHDYQNILSSLDTYIEEGDLEGLKKYYQQTIRPSSKYMQANHFKLSDLSNITIREIKSVVASKLMYAQELGIDALLEAKEPIERINFNSLPLIRILGIFLDNAIEELEYLGSGNLRVALISFEKSTQIIIENSCREDIPPLYKLKKNGFSTKGERRGIGLSNVDELLRENERDGVGVTLETIIDNSTFTQILSFTK